MKKIIAFVSVLILMSFIAPVQVYVCVSKTSVAYHSNKDCLGLRNCTHEVKAISVQEATNMGKRA